MAEKHSWQYLIDRYLANDCSKEELEELLRLVSEQEDIATLDDVLKDHWMKMGAEQKARPDDSRNRRWDARYAVMMQDAAKEAEKDAGSGKPARKKRIWWMAAAAMVLVLGTAGYRIWHARSQEPLAVARPEKPVSRYNDDLLPGSNGAVLTLDGGQKIVLDSAGNRMLAIQSGTRLTNRNGKIIYEGKTSEETTKTGEETTKTGEETTFNTLSTSKGKQYQLVLSDGSKVWLNAASSIRYPVAFPGNARTVEITGEAYFEIAHDPQQPFTVSANGVKVNVLGTSFDINAYSDEPAVRTSLLDGAVQVSTGQTARTLQPGQQAKTDKEGQIRVSSGINTDDIIGWKEGYFSFDNTDLATVMREIARWYDVDIVYEGTVPDRRFGGEISRNSNASKVLKILEASNVHFKIEERKIIVMP
ncbi:MAG TPA: FecR domain-containing protein [Puia sp.]|jgi:ferric-dicitrate binding protein FerR (iron transport regulator)